MRVDKDLEEAVKKIELEIAEQREEILRCFLAKYGLGPEDVEQVVDFGRYNEGVITWSIRKKEGTNGRRR